ncbi:hypothetical protein [Streptomyces griseorubiginosus]|uniref:hypothetical protein n=1 Tax=Streptomyces griseorubiginosus TaxID=67304 RepID=UPI0036613FA2
MDRSTTGWTVSSASPASVPELSAGAEYSYPWSYAKSPAWAMTTGLTVPPKRVGRLAMRLVMRTVRSNPVFYVFYVFYVEITSRGAYYDAVGDVLNRDGTPKEQYAAHDRTRVTMAVVDLAARPKPAADKEIASCR